MNKTRRRKIAYVLAIVTCFTAMIGVGRGLEGLQEKLGIAQKSLGKVNPVSGTAQLVLGGLRGVAVTILWQQAQELKRTERYFEIEPVVESITLLQPHFNAPWEFQAWNLAFNVPAEFESVADKYYWIKRGIQFMQEATQTNRNKADLDWYVGQMYYVRFGVSDEKVFLRQLFREDPDLEFSQSASGIKDNFEKAYDWYKLANDTCFELNVPPKRMAPYTFMSQAPIAKSGYAEALNGEGTFGTTGQEAWDRAHNEWLAFGMRGGSNRDKDILFRLEYTPEEYAKLTDEQRSWRERYARVIKYEFWKLRTKVESTAQMQDAKEAIYLADRARSAGEYSKAIDQYKKGIDLWVAIMNEQPDFRDDINFKEDCQIMEENYLRLLAHTGRPNPVKRPFDGIVAARDESIYGLVQKKLKELEEPEKAPVPDGEE